MITLPLCYEHNFVLSLWLGEYPKYTGSFLILVLILCLVQALKTPRSTIYHATGHILRSNIMVGSVLCAAFPLAYLLLKLGGNPESVFWAANISMIASEFVSIFILKRYINYSITSYLFNIHGRCLLVSILAAALLCFMQRLFEPGLMRVIIISISSVIIVGFLAYTIGINAHLRAGLKRTIQTRLKRK